MDLAIKHVGRHQNPPALSPFRTTAKSAARFSALPVAKTLALLLCVLFAAFLPSSLQAQDSASKQPMRLSPDEAVSLAIKSNLSLESARITSSTKKRASDLSWNQFIPNLTIAQSLIMDNEKAKVSGTVPVDISSMLTVPSPLPSLPAGTVYGVVPYSVEASRWHIAGTIQTSLTVSVAMFENMRRLRLDYETGLIGLEKAKAQLERDVRKSYYNMLLVQENIALLRENFDAAGRRVEMARANYNGGLVPQLTVLQAQVARENLRPAIDQAENGLKMLMAQFAMNLGLPINTEFELIPIDGETSFIDLDMAELISKAASGKPDVQELRQQILVLESARKAQVFSLLPTLSLSWNSTSAFIKNPWKDSWFHSDDWQRSGSLTIAVGVRLHSLLPFSQDFQAIKTLDDQIKTANIGLAQMIQGTEIEIYNTLLSLEKIQITTEVQAETVKLAEQSYRLTEDAYRAGFLNQIEVQDAELSLRQARLQMLEQQFNYLNGLIDLEYSIGVPFGILSSKGDK